MDFKALLSSFLDALDEWGVEDNQERAKAILEFQRHGYDLSEYMETQPKRATN